MLVASKEINARAGRFVAKSRSVAIACNGMMKIKTKADGIKITTAIKLNQTGNSSPDSLRKYSENMATAIADETAKLDHAFNHMRFRLGNFTDSNSVGGDAKGFSAIQ